MPLNTAFFDTFCRILIFCFAVNLPHLGILFCDTTPRLVNRSLRKRRSESCTSEFWKIPEFKRVWTIKNFIRTEKYKVIIERPRQYDTIYYLKKVRFDVALFMPIHSRLLRHRRLNLWKGGNPKVAKPKVISVANQKGGVSQGDGSIRPGAGVGAD